jgi:hypothetical protein
MSALTALKPTHLVLLLLVALLPASAGHPQALMREVR